MEEAKGRQELGGSLAMCMVCGTKLSMSSSVCELSVKSRSSLPSGEPCPPFYRPRGEQGLQMGERGKYQGYRRSFEGSGSSFSFRPALLIRSVGVRGGHVHRVLVC